MLKDPYSMKRGTCRLNLRTFLAKILSASLLGVSAGYCQTAVVGESGIIITEMKNQNRSVMVAVYGTPCAIPTRKQKQ
jgi:hypothetical protein